MFNKFIAFHMARVNFLRHQFTMFNSFHHIPRQHFFGPFSAGAWSTQYTPRRAATQWPRHAWFPPSPDSHRSLDVWFEGSDGWNLLRVMVKAIMLRKRSPDLEHVLQLAPPHATKQYWPFGPWWRGWASPYLKWFTCSITTNLRLPFWAGKR